MISFAPIIPLALAAVSVAQTYSATYLPSNAPQQSEQGQSGTNQCGSSSNQTSECQNAYINAVDDFCLFAPPAPGANATIGDTERIEVSWCIKDGYGTRLIPNGTITGAYFIQTPDFVQITGAGNLTNINIPQGDEGGELDPHGADGNGNPIGGLVFSSAFGSLAQMHEWTNYMSDTEFCFRACKDGPNAPALCQHIYDVMGCMWNMPGNYNPGTFERCLADSGEPMGVYGTSTFFQGEPITPSAHPAPNSSSCTTFTSIGNNLAISTGTTTSGVSATTTGASATTGTAAVSNSSSLPASASATSGSANISAPPQSSSSSSSNSVGSSTRTSTSSNAAQTGGSNGAGARFSFGWETLIAGVAVIMGMALEL